MNRRHLGLAAALILVLGASVYWFAIRASLAATGIGTTPETRSTLDLPPRPDRAAQGTGETPSEAGPPARSSRA